MILQLVISSMRWCTYRRSRSGRWSGMYVHTCA